MLKSYGYLYLECEDYVDDWFEKKLYYSTVLKKWVSYKEYLADGADFHLIPAFFPCHSLKAAERHLRKHSEIPKGTKFRLVNKYIGETDITLIK